MCEMAVERRQIVRRGCFPPEDAAAVVAGSFEAMPGGPAPDAHAQQLPGVTKVCLPASAAHTICHILNSVCSFMTNVPCALLQRNFNDSR